MERTEGMFRRRRNLVGALLVFALAAGTVGALVLGGSSGTERGAKVAVGRSPVETEAPEPSTTTTTVAAAPVATPAASTTGVAAPAAAPEASTPEVAPAAAPAEFLLVCESPVVDTNGIETSSSVVSWVPEGTPIPEHCRRG